MYLTHGPCTRLLLIPPASPASSFAIFHHESVMQSQRPASCLDYSMFSFVDLHLPMQIPLPVIPSGCFLASEILAELRTSVSVPIQLFIRASTVAFTFCSSTRRIHLCPLLGDKPLEGNAICIYLCNSSAYPGIQ